MVRRLHLILLVIEAAVHQHLVVVIYHRLIDLGVVVKFGLIVDHGGVVAGDPLGDFFFVLGLLFRHVNDFSISKLLLLSIKIRCPRSLTLRTRFARRVVTVIDDFAANFFLALRQCAV